MYSRYIVTFCYSSNISHLLPSSLPKNLNIRPCRNLIRTYGVRKTSYLPVSLMKPSSHPTHQNLVGTLYGQPVYQWDGPFWGEDARCWILVPELGIRRVQVDELEKLKGLTNSRYTNMSYNILLQSVEQHVWSVLCRDISPFILPPSIPPPCHHISYPTPICDTITPRNTKVWEWLPPYLSKKKCFYNDRVKSLRTAVDSLGPEMNTFTHRV